ncbi:MAG: T9SS type A sorting domain-containing protein [Bacteroidota bacterium]
MKLFKLNNPVLSVIWILFAMLSTTAIAQTDVSGIYFTNTTWNLAGSPYNLIGDVQVADGATLTIDPAVQINYNGDHEILIKGTLIANGTSPNPIVFNGNTSGTAMIIFKSTNLSNSEISHTHFFGPKRAIQLADESEFNQDAIKNSGLLLVSDVVLTDTEVWTKGYDSFAHLKIRNATITNSTIRGLYPRTETIELKNSTINNSSIHSDSYNYGVKLDQCTVTDTYISVGCCDANLEIVQSEITNCLIDEGGGNPVNGPIVITSSEINNTPLVLPLARVDVTSSSISYNSSVGMYFGNGIFQCSQITGNGSGTAMQITGLDGYNIGGSLDIANSSIYGNNTGIKFDDANVVTIENSNLYDNTTFNIENLSTENIIATSNWWGTTNTTAIENSIFHYFDDINYGQVYFANFLTSASNITTCPFLSTDSVEFEKALIYPNPTDGILMIETGSMEDVFIKIYNIAGQLVQAETKISTPTHELQLTHVPGLYILELTSKGRKQYHKIIRK